MKWARNGAAEKATVTGTRMCWEARAVCNPQIQNRMEKAEKDFQQFGKDVL